MGEAGAAFVESGLVEEVRLVSEQGGMWWERPEAQHLLQPWL